MKTLFTLSALVIISLCCKAQNMPKDSVKADSTKKARMVFTHLEHPPEYPGGNSEFSKYISTNLKYPDVARLIGIDGKIQLTFVVGRDGKVVEVTPLNCIGAGCEAEAVKVLQESKAWKPGMLDGRPVRVQYTVPINFSIPKGKVKLKDLDASQYGFLFNIKGQLYTLDEAKAIIGKAFESDEIQIAEPFYNADNNVKYVMPNKKGIYVIYLKG